MAIRLAEDALERAERSGGTPAVRALLERVRAAAYSQRESPQEARRALERALEIARHDHIEYETALALRALAELERRYGDADAGQTAAEASREIFARLGVDADAVP